MTNPLKIYSGSNALLYTTPINTGCRRRVQLMNEDSITVKFSDKTKMKFPVGTRIGDFYITKEQQEKYNATTGGYDYELKFDAYYWLWANRLLFYVMPGVTNAPKETSFKLTATIDVHAAVILRALNALGFTYNGSPFRVDTDEGFSTEAKYISYANMSVLGGIQAIADAYECEWWVVGNSIHFGKCNAIGEYDFTVGENVASITSDAKTTPANRLVVFGSTRNLPPNYRTPESSDVVDAVVVKRLMLPEGTPYLQTSPDIPEDEIVEEEVVLDSVYPRTSLTVTDVETYDSTNDGMTQTFYRIKYGTAFHFSKDYILPDEELHVVFESGDLNGMDFAVKFNPLGLAEKKDDGFFNPEAQMFEIVANEDYGRSLPDAVLHPAKTDKFSLYGWDSTKMEALVLLATAEQELLTEGNKLLDEYRKDKQTYTCPMMWDWCKVQAEEGNTPRLGSVVNLHFVAGDTGRKSRIIGFEHDLDIEYSNVTYICGEKVSVSRLKTLESKVEGLTHDGTKVKVQNSLDFLSKRYSDRTPYQLASDMGFDVGQFLASVSGGRFGIDKVTGQSFLEVDRIFARVRAYFESLTVVERESLAGEQMVTPGGGVKCTSVEEVRNAQNVLTGWRCYFLSEQDGEKRETKIIVGDQAIAQTFNAKAGTTNKVSNHRWWRLVTGVSNNAYTDDSGNIYGYIEVSKSDCETDSDTPKEGDDVIQFGNRTDKTRQAAILISTVATDAPSIKLLTGIDHYSLVGKDIISQGYDAAKGHAYFRCYGDTYIGAPDGSTYVKYDVDSKKLTVKADLEVGSTIGGKDAEDFVKDLIPEIPELTQEDIEDFVNNIVDPKIEGIQDQIDGVVESFFGFGAPTLSNYPANEWTTDELRKAHERDTYTDKTEYVDDVTTPTAGMSWKWQYTSPTDYGWVKIADSDATRALLDAARAQDTADGKRRTFTAQPVPPYDKGDIWVNATYPAGNTVKDAASGKYHNDILRCNTSRATGSFAIGDWGLASNYTDDTAALAAAAAAQAAKNAADAAQSAANAAQSSVTSLNDYVNGAFKDGIIDETEASGIANYINIVNADKERIDGTYQTLYANAYLSATGKAALKTAHDDVAAKITALISAINSAIADNKVTAAESAAVNSAFSAFSTSNKAFSAAVETANEEIQQTLKSAADAAKTAADNAKAAADAAKGVADAAKDRLDSWAADGVISPTEKQAIKDEIARIDADKAHIAAEYTRYSLGTPTDYNAAHSAYRAQLVTLSASTPESITIPPYFSANQTAYYNQRTAALSAIATAAKKYADDVAKEEAKKATDVYKYLKESLLNAQQESTETSGGLILSTMMALGYTENGVKKILSGMNGSYVSSLGGRTIASWYGGHMLDLFDKNDSRIANPTGQEATSLIRMDGSFYFANGNIGGRTDGSGWLAGNNITWDASGAITFGNGIHIDLGSGNSTTLGGLNSKLSGVETTVGSVLTLVNALSNVLVPVNSSGTRVAWDSADLFAVKSVKGFYSEEFVSARGMSGQSSSISKYLTDLLDVGISAPASGQALVYNGSKWVNQAIQTGLDTTQLANYLTTNNYAKKSDIPTNYVTLNTAQTISGEKTFEGYLFFRDKASKKGLYLKAVDSTGDVMFPQHENNKYKGEAFTFYYDGTFLANSIKKRGGTSSQVLNADGSVTTKHSLSSVTNLGWGGTAGQITTINTLANWNGQFSSGVSNLQYCDRGRFGTMATATATDYLARSGGSMTNTNVVTNLNADLWDGQQIADFRMRKHYTLDLSSLSTSNFYPIIFDNTDLELDCEIHSPNLSGAAAYNQNHIHFLLTAQGWTDTVRVFRILSQGVYSTEEITIGAIGYGTRQGEKCVWVRGGMKYRILSNHTPTLKTSSYTVNEQTFSVGTNLYGGTNTKVEIAWQNNSTRSNSQFAVLSSNVASATKLQTARTIWGQSFDGTGNVSGDIIGAAGGVAIHNGNEINSFNGDLYLNHKGVNRPDTLGTTRNIYMVCNGGSVGIGTASPSAKLDVSGTVRATNIKIGDVVISYDSNAKGLKISGGGLYSESYVSARGKNPNESGGSTGATTLGMLDDVNLSTPVSSGQALIYNGSKWVNGSAGLNESQLASYLNTNNYATKSWVESKSYITSSALSGYATQSWVESKGYLTSHQSLANYVTLNTAQTISGEKTFEGYLFFRDKASKKGLYLKPVDSTGDVMFPQHENNNYKGEAFTFYYDGTFLANSIKKRGGTSSQFLKADGSVDSNSYLTTGSAASTYVKKAGDTMSGTLSILGTSGNPYRYVRVGMQDAESLYLHNGYVDGSRVALLSIYSADANKGGIGVSLTRPFYQNASGSLFTLWHSGNDGSGSGLDADLLDGYHATSFARLSSSNATVGASNLPVYLNAGTVTAVSSVGEAFLSWGGRNYAGTFGPVDAAIAPRLGANRLAFARPDGTTFQYSTDGGSSWTDYGLTATQKRAFFDAGVGYALAAGKAANGAMTTNHQLRVIINTGSADIYTELKKFIIYVSTNGVSGLTVTIERALQSTPTSFVTAASNVPLNGWSGYNVINVAGFVTYGHTPSQQYGVIRFTFKCTGAGTNKNPFYIYSIMGFGGMGWTAPSQLALNGHLYSYDGDQNATFPAKVTAASFAGSLSGNASSATQLQTARTIWGQSFNGTGNVSGDIIGAAGGVAIHNSNEINSFNGDLYLNHKGVNRPDTLGTTRNIYMVCNGGSVGIGTASPSRKLHVNGDIQTSSIYASNWLRTTGNAGWYSESYGGGWYMTDSTWIRNYGNKSLYMNTATIRTDYQFDRQGYAGSSWDKGYGAYNVAITDNSNQTPLMVAYRAGQSAAVTGANRLFALGLLNSGTSLQFGFGGARKFEMSSTGVFHAIGGIYSDGYVSARGQNTSSDERLKNILRPLSLNVRDIANAPSVEFIWRKDGIKDVGSIAQYWKRLIPQLAPEMPDGSMGLQYGKTALMSVIAVAKKTVSLEERITQLESENRELKAQISQLKTQLA